MTTLFHVDAFFDPNYIFVNSFNMYDVTRDGQRFLVNTRTGEAPAPSPLILVQHFDAELRNLQEHLP